MSEGGGDAPRAVKRQGWRYVTAAILLCGLLLKAILVNPQAVSFDSDEAVVALMARHILAGERPIFFYGQTYMGSLDAFLTAAAFRLFGTSVFAMRLVQTFLFVGLVLVTYRLARRLFPDEITAWIGALLTALPTALLSLYTTVTLGGYGETLFFGIWLLLLGHQITHEAQGSWAHWTLMGLIGGLAFWTLPLSVVYLVPITLAVLYRWRWRLGGRYGLAIVAFLLGSSPWWGYCLGHGDACFKPLTDSAAELVISGSWIQAVGHRAFSFLFLGIPALWGLRYPWTGQYILSPVVIPALALYLAGIVTVFRAAGRDRFLPLALGATFLLVFLGTPFGNDATGRYLLPLYLLVALSAAEVITRLQRDNRWLAGATLVTVLAFNVGSTATGAATEPAGMTAQLDARLQFGNRHDADLIAFLEGADELHGYSNYWVAFKINFLSGEEIILAPRLPYKADLSYNPADDRYPAYSQQVDHSPTPPCYVTSNQPELDERLRGALEVRGIEYGEQVIGPYRVFYHLSRAVLPETLVLKTCGKKSSSTLTMK